MNYNKTPHSSVVRASFEVSFNESSLIYRQTSNIRLSLVGNKLADHSDVVGAMSLLLQLHLHSRLNTWFQWIGQRQLRDERRNI